jgi:hypothetical protein
VTKKNETKKLSLSRETVRSLTEVQLGQVASGFRVTSAARIQTCGGPSAPPCC